MEYLFVSIYDYFQKHPRVMWGVFTSVILLSVFSALRIEIKENVSEIFPDDKKSGGLNQVLQSRALEKLVFMVSLKDSTLSDPDRLVAFADSLVLEIDTHQAFIKEINYRIDDERALDFFNTVSDHLPIFLTDADYVALDSLLKPTNFRNRIKENYHQLISPSGIFMKRIYAKDILGISQLGLNKLQQLRYDDNYVLYDNCLFTQDLKHLIFFIVPQYPSSYTGNNIILIDELNKIVKTQSSQYPDFQTTYFGGTAVAVGNAQQIRDDTKLTISLMIFLLVILVFWFFKRKRAPLVVLIPVGFGGLFSVACLALVKGSVSALALAAGSIILGIAVNYSLHFIIHIQHARNIRETIRDLARPMTLGSSTTVLAFFGLQFANAVILRDIGLFAAFSLIGAALCTLIFLPHFFKYDFFQANERAEKHIEKFLSFEPSKNKWVISTIILLTPVLFYFAGNVKFNSDMNKLNFMTPELKQAQEELNVINEFSLQSVYLLVSGKDEQQAFRNNESIQEFLGQAKAEGMTEKFLTPSVLLVSDSLQHVRIEKWNAYWTEAKKESALKALIEEGQKFKFSPAVYTSFANFINQPYAPADSSSLAELKNNFFPESVLTDDDHVTVITPVMVKPELKDKFYESVQHYPIVQAVDRQTLTNSFIEKVNSDFTFIVMFTSVLVFAALLIAYGRIELALITFIPMFITWIWILGIMALIGLEFNIVNVMISTFIFGLGDDYSIFTMGGLQQEYKTGKKNLSTVRVSIFISAITTITGLGVLLFAKHPALESIALISITGIVCVFVMSQTIEPFLFNLLISGRANRGIAPITLWGLFKTVFSFSLFALGSVVLSIIGVILLKLIPFQRAKCRRLYHKLLRSFTSGIIYTMTNLKKRVINQEGVYDKPSIIISNHISFLDILLTTMLAPNVILLTNKWVWNSPVFGAVVRLAEFYPVLEGAEQGIDKLKRKVEEGFSIVVFPEGTRSLNGEVGRFHKGAFFLAEKLKLGIRPLLIRGTNNGIQKADFYVHDAYITMKFLPLIYPDDQRFGISYQERTKSISQYFKRELSLFASEIETPDHFRYKLMRNYYYKGPVLEWYLRIKLRLENNYEKFNELVPREAKILDLGCGYGFMSYMLHFVSKDRHITGVDYDQDKIDTANHCYSKTENISFYCDDVVSFPISNYDVIIISDVLHYLTPTQQIEVLGKCFSGINKGGKVIIREGNAELEKKHHGTKLTEFFSTRFFRFNKSVNELSFLRGETIKQVAQKYNLTVEILDDSKFTSNVIFEVK